MADSMPLEHSALLVMDVQQAIVERYGGALPILEPLGAAIKAAHSAAIPVIYVVVKFRDGYPEVSQRNKSFSAIRAGSGLNFSGSSSASEVHSSVAPQPDDIVVAKRRVSGFTGSDLEVVLRAKEVDTLILTGIATSGVVLSTLRQAADMDYRLGVLSDCCADSDEEVHRVLLTKVFPRQATIMTAAEWIEMLPQR